MPNVSNVVKSIQDIMRKDAGTYGDAQRLEQLGWMFFLKIFDDREQEMELLLNAYKSPLPQPLRWSVWAKDEEGITGDALLDELFRVTLELGGTITGEHGVGLSKKRWLPLELSEDVLALSLRVKSAFDPAGILNPGKIFAL